MNKRVFFYIGLNSIAVCNSRTIAWALIRNACKEKKLEVPTMDKIFEKDFAYSALHVPTGDVLDVIGIDIGNKKLCALPMMLYDIKDCVSITPIRPLTKVELDLREKAFGNYNWV